MNSASITESTSAVPTRSSEFHVALPTMSATGRWVRNESPQSPCTKSPSQSDVLRGPGLVEVVLALEVLQGLLRDAGPVA